MKRYLHLLLTLLLLSVCTVGGAQKTVTYTVKSTSEVEVTSSDAPIGTTATYASTYTNKYQLISGDSMTLTLSGYAGKKITGLKLSMRSNAKAGAGYLDAKVGSKTLASLGSSKNGEAYNKWYGNKSYSTSYKDVNATVTAKTVEKGEDIVITVGATVNSLYVQSFTLTYENASDKSIPGLSYSSATATAIIGEKFTAPTLSKPSNLPVSYTSSNSNVAEVNATTGEVTIKSSGETTITASSDETDTYLADNTSYTLIVASGKATMTFNATSDKFETNSGTKDGVTISITGGTLNNGTDYRTYKSNKLTISSDNYITKVVFTCTASGTSKGGPGCFRDPSDGNYSYNGKIGTWEGIANKFTLIASTDQVRASKIEVTYLSTKTITKLSFADGDKTFTQGDTDGLTFTNAATLTPAVDGATITYSSSDENIATVDETGKVSVKTDNTGSATITATYVGDATYEGSTASYNITVAPKLTGAGTEANPYTVADVIALNNAGLLPTDSAYVKGIISEVGSDYDSSYGEVSYYISDDGTTTNQLNVYQGLGLNGDKFTAATDLQTGWTVVVKGILKVYKSTLEFNYGSKITSLTKPVTYTKATLTGFAQSGNDYYATFSSDAVTFFPNDVTVYGVVAENKQLTMTSGEDGLFTSGTVTIDDNEVKGYYVPANTGVLINAIDASATYYTVANKTVDAIDNSFNMLYPASKAMSELGDSYYFYKLAYDDYSAKTGLGFYWGADNGTVFTAKTNGAYLAVPKSSTSAKSAFRFDGTTTGVNTINAKTTTNDVIYNIQGQRVGANYKGLVIVNGKKMMRK